MVEAFGLECLDETGLLGPKNVEGLMRGYDDNDGGGIPVGKVCVDDANEACAILGSTGEGMDPVAFKVVLRAPPAANTAGGIACIRVSS